MAGLWVCAIGYSRVLRTNARTPMTVLPSISQRIATEIASRESQVAAAVQLLDEGATVPFIARY